MSSFCKKSLSLNPLPSIKVKVKVVFHSPLPGSSSLGGHWGALYDFSEWCAVAGINRWNHTCTENEEWIMNVLQRKEKLYTDECYVVKLYCNF